MIREPKKPFRFSITPQNIADGVPSDKNFCVIAEGIKETLRSRGVPVLSVQVGPVRTVVVLPRGEWRYATPSVLKQAAEHFDQTKVWMLPVGEYRLQPLAHSLRAFVRKQLDRGRRRSGKCLPAGSVRRERYVRISPRITAFDRMGKRVALAMQGA